MTPKPSPVIRRATTGDAPALAVLGAATFTETFGHLYPQEDLHAFLAGAHSMGLWERALADPQRATWIAVADESTPIGFISVGACKLPVKHCEPTAGEIQQLYVLAHHHNLRLGSLLMHVGLEWLEGTGRKPVYVGVWSGNSGAQRFYARYGFEKIGEYGFPVGKVTDREFILKKQAGGNRPGA